MTNLIILAGIPGCGKSTYAAALNGTVVSSDAIRQSLFGSLDQNHNQRVFNVFNTQVRTSLRARKNVIADATNLDQLSRKKLVRIAKDEGAQAHLVIFKNIDQAIKRNANRNGEQQVPDAVMLRMVNKLYKSLEEILREPYDTVTKIESFA